MAALLGWSHRRPGLALGRGAEAVENLVHLLVVRLLLHVADPALNVGIALEIAMDELTNTHDCRAEIVRDGDLVTADILLVAGQPVIVQDLQPGLAAVLRPRDRAGMGLLVGPLV